MDKFNVNSVISRRTMAIIFFVVAVFVLVPAAVNTYSHNSIVNSRVISVHSPIDGLVKNLTVRPGDSVQFQEHVLTVSNTRINESFVHELEVERNSLQSRVDGYKSHLVELEKLKRSLEQRTGQTKKFNSSHVDLELAKAREQMLAQQAVTAERELYYTRIKPMAETGAMSIHDVDAAKFSMEENRNKLKALKIRVKELETERAALANNVNLGEGRNDVPYTRQRLDEVIMVISDYKTRSFEQETRIAEIDRQIAIERVRLATAKEAAIQSPLDGVVWKGYVSNGSEVVSGTELLQIVDCKNLFVESAVSESTLQNVDVGSQVKYRLIGSSQWYTGTVYQKIGSGNKKQDVTLAALLDVERNQSSRVLVKLDPKDTSAKDKNFCNIGRKVEVSLPRSYNVFSWVNRLTSLL